MGISETVGLLLSFSNKLLSEKAKAAHAGSKYYQQWTASSYSTSPPHAVIRDMTLWARSRFSVMDGTDSYRCKSMRQIFSDFLDELQARFATQETNVVVCLFDDKNNLGLRKTQRLPKPLPPGMTQEVADSLCRVPDSNDEPFANLSFCIHSSLGLTSVVKRLREICLSPDGMRSISRIIGGNQILVLDTPAGHGVDTSSVVDFFFRVGGYDSVMHQRRYELGNCIGEGDLKVPFWVHQFLTTIRSDFGLSYPCPPRIVIVSGDTDQLVIMLLNAYLWKEKGEWTASVVHHLEKLRRSNKAPENFISVNLMYDVLVDSFLDELSWSGMKRFVAEVGIMSSVATVALMQESDFCPKWFVGCGIDKVFDIAMRDVMINGPPWKIHAEKVLFCERRPRSDDRLIHFSVVSSTDTERFVERVANRCSGADRSRYQFSRLHEDMGKIQKVRNVLQYWMNAPVDPGRRREPPRRLYNAPSYEDPRTSRAMSRCPSESTEPAPSCGSGSGAAVEVVVDSGLVPPPAAGCPGGTQCPVEPAPSPSPCEPDLFSEDVSSVIAEGLGC